MRNRTLMLALCMAITLSVMTACSDNEGKMDNTNKTEKSSDGGADTKLESKRVMKKSVTTCNGEVEATNEYVYDKYGRLIELINDSSLWGKTTTLYAYDDKDNVVKEAEYSVEEPKEAQIVTENTYNVSGVLTHKVITMGDIKYDYKYDDKGNETEHKMISDGEEKYLSKKEYDDKGKVIRENFYNGSEINGYFEYEYDSRGNVIKEFTYEVEKGDEPVSWTEYEYNEKDDMTARRYYGGNDAEEIVLLYEDINEYEYTEDGECKRHVESIYELVDGEKVLNETNEYSYEYEYEEISIEVR